MAEIICHNRNFSKIDPLGQNHAATVIQIIVRNNSTAFLVDRIYFLRVFCIENTGDSRKHFY